jgi:hypothetical protein
MRGKQARGKQEGKARGEETKLFEFFLFFFIFIIHSQRFRDLSRVGKHGGKEGIIDEENQKPKKK